MPLRAIVVHAVDERAALEPTISTQQEGGVP